MAKFIHLKSFLFLFVGIIRLSAASQLDTAYLHHLWQFDDGLPQNSVQAAIQTHDGYVWAATPKGLARFDGVTFTVFTPENLPELKTLSITALCETKDGSFWIGTDNGLLRLKDGKFISYGEKEGLLNEHIRSLFEDKDGALWVGTTASVFSYNFIQEKFSAFAPPHWPVKEVVRSMAQDKTGTMWFGTGLGVYRWQNNVGSLFNFQNTENWGKSNSIPNNSIRAVYCDRQGNVWLGSNRGLTLFQEGHCITFTREHGLADYIVTAIYEDHSGNLWIGSYGGLNRMKQTLPVRKLDPLFQSSISFYKEVNAEGAPYDAVNSIFEDREGNMWIGAKDGLSRIKNRDFIAFTQQDGLTHNNVTSIRTSSAGGLWIGTWGGGLNYYKDGFFTNYNTGGLVLGTFETAGNKVWYGTDYDGGLFRLENGKSIQMNFPDPAIKVLQQDRKGDLWIGTMSALDRLSNGKVTRYTTTNGLPGNLIRAILEDHEGNLWFGTGSGLSVRKDDRFISFTRTNGLSSDVINALYEDENHTLWIGTLTGGLNKYKDGKFTSYTTANGLFKDEIFEIIEDDFDNLWMTCRFGVFRVSKKEIEAFDRGDVRSITSVPYGKYEGMVSLECSAVAKPGACKTKDGRLWFPTAKGIAVVDPNYSLKINEVPPPVVIEQVFHNHVRIDSTKERALPPSRGEMEFRYAALSFVEPAKNRFKYKLEGVDENWIDAGKRREAYYSKLPPGHYRFRVIACNNDDVWNETGASFEFQLKPYFYQRSSFYGLVALFIGLSGFGIHGFRVRHLRAREQELTKLVDERTKDLQAEIAERELVQAENDAVHLRLLDVSRKAGMAEVATGVLHNVGNVLNSVNVSTSLVAEQIRNSKTANLAKVCTLLEEHKDNPGDFIAHDPRGQKIPDYLQNLSNQLIAEQKEMSRELVSLSKNIDHIKDIVAMQQSYAKVSGVVETIEIVDMVEDALHMNACALVRHDVQVVREFAKLPPITVEKHKVLQILVNLIRNAKYACDGSKEAVRKITLRTFQEGDFAVIQVIDNGVGIAAENLTKIFGHGFTTRKEGHGFGLHSGSLAAHELGGSLTVESPGVFQGATFSLKLPYQFVANRENLFQHSSKRDDLKKADARKSAETLNGASFAGTKPSAA